MPPKPPKKSLRTPPKPEPLPLIEQLQNYITRCLRDHGRRPESLPVTRAELYQFERENSDIGFHQYTQIRRQPPYLQPQGPEYHGIPLIERPDAEALRSAGALCAKPMPDAKAAAGRTAMPMAPDFGAIMGIREVRVPSTKLGATVNFDRSLEDYPDAAGILVREIEGIHLAMRTKVYGHRDQQPEAVSYPADWWEHFKQRWFPDVLLELFPIKWKVHRFTFSELYPGMKPRIPGEDVAIVLQMQPVYETRF